MALNKGKQWEAKVKEDFSKLPYSTIDRIYDVTTGHKSISNICDAIGFIGDPELDKGVMFYAECKSCKGNTFPLTNLTQYEKLAAKVGIPGVRSGVFLWFIEHQIVLYVPTSTVTQMKKDGKKSVNIKMISTGEYNLKLIPSVTKRVFPECDYSVLKELKIGE